MTAKVIFLEGANYCGKSNIIRLLEDELKKQNKKVVSTREPGGDQIGESIRKILLDKDLNTKYEMDYICRRLLYSASHAQLLSYLKSAISEYDFILVDRYNPVSDFVYGPMSSIEIWNNVSSFEDYQNFMRLNKKFFKIYEVFDNEFLKDIGYLFFIDISEETLVKRNNKRGTTENKLYDYRDLAFKKDILAKYKFFARSYNQGELKKIFPFSKIFVINNDNSSQEATSEIIKIIINNSRGDKIEKRKN